MSVGAAASTLINSCYCGDAAAGLREFKSQGIEADCCVTSPPYYGLRDYGVAGQIGQEPTPAEYVRHLVDVFRGVKEVLKDDGTLWINIGDSYAGSGKSLSGHSGPVKPKDLIGIPWLLALALRDDGWYLRQDIIWNKPNAMPESVRDRCTNSHEYIFLLSKSKEYYYDQDAIKEPFESIPTAKKACRKVSVYQNKAMGYPIKPKVDEGMVVTFGKGGRNKRSVWTVTTKPCKVAHFAAFPPDLIEPCILAGCPQGGIVLDPFMGSGTTALVAQRNFRDWIGCELNPDYIDIQKQRINAI